jgi:hypothetical protein
LILGRFGAKLRTCGLLDCGSIAHIYN